MFYRLNEIMCITRSTSDDWYSSLHIVFFSSHIQDDFKLDYKKEHSLSKSMTIFTALVMYCQIIFLQNDFSWFIMQPASMNLPHPLWILAPPTMVFVYLASNVCCLVAVLIGISYIYDCSPSFWNSIYVLTHLSARASIVLAC